MLKTKQILSTQVNFFKSSVRLFVTHKIGGFDLLPQRVFPVGRLDQLSSGLILLTSDGRISQAMLGGSSRISKEYDVILRFPPSIEQLDRMREGVIIRTNLVNDQRTKSITAKTRPCQVELVSEDSSNEKSRRLKIILEEGRNRQIRRMAMEVGNEVEELHRISFAGITLDGLSGPGYSAQLNDEEMKIINKTLMK